ncbi:MAG: tRNA (guanosine(37)-N1)-methyltransferase TrmD, partial [Pseudomonadota bacterium]|nr:tRNA (guanosine(37)-N1)-methyltransferase TrmD [Pseudomonadota bacterium]
FSSKLLDHEHYTRPEYFSGLKCPEVLLGGDHKKIAEWRLQQALGKTWLQRPDMLATKLDCNEKKLLLQYVANYLATHEDKA